jgi:heat shock protein HslJ
MKSTDLERELRATLIAAGQQAPVVDDLVTRAVTPVRRRRTWLASGLAVVAMGAVGVVIAVAAPDGKETAGVASPSSSASTKTLTDALIGTWRPVDIVGFDNSKLPPASGPPVGRAPNITFAIGGRWTGTDGCNGIGGTYNAGDDGSITADASGRITTASCMNVPNRAVLGTAARFTIDRRTLTLYAADGHRLGTYERV